MKEMLKEQLLCSNPSLNKVYNSEKNEQVKEKKAEVSLPVVWAPKKGDWVAPGIF